MPIGEEVERRAQRHLAARDGDAGLSAVDHVGARTVRFEDGTLSLGKFTTGRRRRRRRRRRERHPESGLRKGHATSQRAIGLVERSRQHRTRCSRIQLKHTGTNRRVQSCIHTMTDQNMYLFIRHCDLIFTKISLRMPTL